MPIQIQNKEFTDIFGNDLGFYQSNAGDLTAVTLTIHSNISVTSINNPLTLDISTYQIFSATTGWLDEGIRLGDTVNISFYDNTSSTPLNSYNATINYVDNDYIEVSTLLGWFDITLGQFAVITVIDRDRDTLEINVNHVLNNVTGSEFSLIDGEATRAKFEGINSMIVGDDITGVKVGNQSGQFNVASILERITDAPNDQRAYKLYIYIINSGIYNQSWFNSSNCLKFYLKLSWSSLANEPFGQTVKILNDTANTGWFNEGFNASVIDATLIQGVNQLSYNLSTGFQIVIDSASSDFGFGACYVSIDANYYKNKLESQSVFGMIIPTREFTLTIPETSETNLTGAGYELIVNNITTVGTVHTIDLQFNPNPDFATFFDSVEDGNRLFYIWAKYGNVNLLVFNGQLIKTAPTGGPIDVYKADYFDHSQQIVNPVNITTGYESNIEDDLSFQMDFWLNSGEQYESLTAKIEAFNTVTYESFDLFTTFFDFSAVPFFGNQHILNFNQIINPELPTTSVKRAATLSLNPSIDVAGKYGATLFFPFIERWQYWLPQLNANAEFFPFLQNQNWLNYEFSPSGDWTVQTKIILVKSGLSYVYADPITIKKYNSDPVIDQTITLIRDSDNQIVTSVIDGELMRIRVNNVLDNGENWNIDNTWGQITIEPFESAPRFMVSSVVPYDFNPNNPLSPISGALVPVTYPTGDNAQMECYFNPNVINLTNGVKITCKVKGCAGLEFASYKITTDGQYKNTTDYEQKIIS
jgi:hypothetical protein